MLSFLDSSLLWVLWQWNSSPWQLFVLNGIDNQTQNKQTQNNNNKNKTKKKAPGIKQNIKQNSFCFWKEPTFLFVSEKNHLFSYFKQAGFARLCVCSQTMDLSYAVLRYTWMQHISD